MKVRFMKGEVYVQKLTLCKVQAQYLGISLADAKTNIDDLVDGKIIEVEVTNPKIIDEFVEQVKQAGLICELIS